MASCQDKLLEEVVDKAEKCFLLPLLWEDITIDSTTDKTVDPSFRGELGSTWAVLGFRA